MFGSLRLRRVRNVPHPSFFSYTATPFFYRPRAPTDGRSFISAAHDKTALIRDSATGNWLHKLEGHRGAVWAAKLDASGRLAATGSGDSSARLWALEPVEDGASYNRPATVHEFVHKKVVRTVEFSPVRGGEGRRAREAPKYPTTTTTPPPPPPPPPPPFSSGRRRTAST